MYKRGITVDYGLSLVLDQAVPNPNIRRPRVQKEFTYFETFMQTTCPKFLALQLVVAAWDFSSKQLRKWIQRFA